MAEMLEEKWPKGVMASIAFFFVLILMLATVALSALAWVSAAESFLIASLS